MPTCTSRKKEGQDTQRIVIFRCIFLRIVDTWCSLAEQCLHGDEAIALLLERAEDAGHGIDRGGMDVVHEDDSAWPRTSNGTVADDGAIAIGPVACIDRP